MVVVLMCLLEGGLFVKELVTSNLNIKKLMALFHRPPDPGNFSIFFEELSESLSKAILK